MDTYYILAALTGFVLGVLCAVMAWWGVVMALRPKVAIDNRIYYAPLEMRYHYCIRITNRSRRHCLFDLEFNSDLICGSERSAEQSGLPEGVPSLRIWALPDACLRPNESRMYYLYLAPPDQQAALTEGEEQALKGAPDFRSVFQKTSAAELQIRLKCKHGYSGYSRVFYKKFIKKDFYNHLKLEA